MVKLSNMYIIWAGGGGGGGRGGGDNALVSATNTYILWAMQSMHWSESCSNTVNTYICIRTTPYMDDFYRWHIHETTICIDL